VSIPPKPIALTPATRSAAGQSSGAASTRRAASSVVIAGCGRSQPVVGGSTPSRTAIVALISPATPAAAFVWPMFALIDPTAARSGRGPADAPPPRRAWVSARNSVASPTTVPVP
jgi:hypothetical protein